MSGIAGVWNVDGRPVQPDILPAMGAAIAHRGRDPEGSRVDRSAGLLCRHLWNTPEEHGERQPCVSTSGAMLVMDGRLDNRDELLRALNIPAGSSDATIALAAYDTWPEAWVERLNGDFAIAIFDAARDRLVVARDSIGVRPLYYYSDARIFAFASEIKALLAHPLIHSTPDDEGLADYLMNSARPLDRQELTCFRGISAVVPAHIGTVTRERVTMRRYWDFDTGLTIRLASFGEYAEAFRERFAEAVRRRSRSPHPVAVSLSGGLDSSSIFCQAETLRRAGSIATPEIAGVSYFSERVETDERHYLVDIENTYGTSIERFPIEPHVGLARDIERQIGAIEAPLVDYLFGMTCELHRRAAARGARTLISGHWGDQVLFSAAYLVDLFNGFAWNTIQRHTREYARYFGRDETRVLQRRFVFDAVKHHVPRALLPGLKRLRLRFFPVQNPKSWYSDAFMSNALRFQHHVASFDRRFHSAHARSVYLEARSKYHVHCMELNNKVAALYGLDAVFPFLDRDLLSFLMAIPGEMHARDGVPRALLREAMRGVLPDPIRARTWKSDFTPFVNGSVMQDRSAILQALSHHSRGAQLGYFDASRLEPELARLAGNVGMTDAVEGWNLADTFGFEVWLQLFSDAPRTGSPAPRPISSQERSNEAEE